MTTLQWVRKSANSAVACCLALFACHGTWAQGKAPVVGEMEHVQIREEVSSDPSGVLWRLERSFNGAMGVFVGLRNLKLPPGTSLVVRGPDTEVPALQVSAAEADAKSHWVPIMGSTKAVIELRGQVIGVKAFEMLMSIGAASPGGRPFSYKDPPRFELLNASSPLVFQEAAKSVAAVYWVDGSNWRVCSGFMVSRRHFVSNHHCVATPADCESARVVFGYREHPDRVEPGRWFACKSVVDNLKVRSLDVGALELHVPPGVTDPPGPLNLSPALPASGLALIMLQHPFGLPMRLVKSGCGVVRWPAHSPTDGTLSDIAHQCDTADGSSGSPVLDSQGRLMGIHHWGFQGLDEYRELNRAIWAGGAVREFLSTLKD